MSKSNIKANNAYDLTQVTGCEGTEGVLVSIFPEKILKVGATGETYQDTKGQVRGVLGDIEGETRLLDLVGVDPERTPKLKWWKVREFARQEGYDLVSELWHGPIEEVPQDYFKSEFLGIRFYTHGPWFWPRETPEVVLEEDPDEARVKQLMKEMGL